MGWKFCGTDGSFPGFGKVMISSALNMSLGNEEEEAASLYRLRRYGANVDLC